MQGRKNLLLVELPHDDLVVIAQGHQQLLVLLVEVD
jgi:hypothetical protein